MGHSAAFLQLYFFSFFFLYDPILPYFFEIFFTTRSLVPGSTYPSGFSFPFLSPPLLFFNFLYFRSFTRFLFHFFFSLFTLLKRFPFILFIFLHSFPSYSFLLFFFSFYLSTSSLFFLIIVFFFHSFSYISCCLFYSFFSRLSSPVACKMFAWGGKNLCRQDIITCQICLDLPGPLNKPIFNFGKGDFFFFLASHNPQRLPSPHFYSTLVKPVTRLPNLISSSILPSFQLYSCQPWPRKIIRQLYQTPMSLSLWDREPGSAGFLIVAETAGGKTR